MESMTEWLSFADKLGVGATFVLGIVSFFLWKALRSEHSYSRQRDKETLTVISNLTAMLDKQSVNDSNNISKLVESIQSLLVSLKEHDKSSSDLLRVLMERVDRLYISLVEK